MNPSLSLLALQVKKVLHVRDADQLTPQQLREVAASAGPLIALLPAEIALDLRLAATPTSVEGF